MTQVDPRYADALAHAQRQQQMAYMRYMQGLQQQRMMQQQQMQQQQMQMMLAMQQAQLTPDEQRRQAVQRAGIESSRQREMEMRQEKQFYREPDALERYEQQRQQKQMQQQRQQMPGQGMFEEKIPNFSPDSRTTIDSGKFNTLAGMDVEAPTDTGAAAAQSKAFSARPNIFTGKVSVYGGPGRGFIKIDDNDERLSITRTTARAAERNLQKKKEFFDNEQPDSEVSKMVNGQIARQKAIADGSPVTSLQSRLQRDNKIADRFGKIADNERILQDMSGIPDSYQTRKESVLNALDILGHPLAEVTRRYTYRSRSPGVKPASGFKLNLPKTSSMAQKMQAILDGDDAKKLKQMNNLVIGREEDDKEFRLEFKTAASREKFRKMMNEDVQLDEKKKPISTRLGDAFDSGELEDRIKSMSGPARKSFMNLANSLTDFYHSMGDIHQVDGRELEDKIDGSPPRVRKMFAKLLDEAMAPFNPMGGGKRKPATNIGKDLRNQLQMTKPSEYSFSAPAVGGGTFAVIPIKSSRPSSQAGVMMAIFDGRGKVSAYYGTHMDTDSARKFAKRDGLIESVNEERFKEPKKVNYKGGTALPSTMAKGRKPVVISTPRGFIVQTYNKKRDIFSQEGPAYKTRSEAEKAAKLLESAGQLDEMMLFTFDKSEDAFEFTRQAVRKRLASSADNFVDYKLGKAIAEIQPPVGAVPSKPSRVHTELAKLLKQFGGKFLRSNEGKALEKVFERFETAAVSKTRESMRKPMVKKTKFGFQVMVYSPTKKGYIAQGQPHKTKAAAEKDAKMFESVQIDENTRQSMRNMYSVATMRPTKAIQDLVKKLDKRAKQEIADALNDMNLGGYGDYEARLDNVHKFNPKDLKSAMFKVLRLSESLRLDPRLHELRNIPDAFERTRNIKSVFKDSDIKRLSKSVGNEAYDGGFRGDKADLPGSVKDMVRNIHAYSDNDLIVILLADIPHASGQARMALQGRGHEVKFNPQRKSDIKLRKS